MKIITSIVMRHRIKVAASLLLIASALPALANVHDNTAGTLSATHSYQTTTGVGAVTTSNSAVATSTPRVPGGTVGVVGATGSVSANPTSLVSAADPVPLNNDEFYQRQTQLQYQIQLLKLESEAAELRKKIADASNDQSLAPPSVIVAPPASMTPQSGTPINPPHGGGSPLSLSLPDMVVPTAAAFAVTSVLGVNGAYTAQVVDHGIDTSVTDGSILSEGWRVEKISPSKVVLIRGRSRKTLTVSGG